jgi:hypothetical protein
MNTNIRTIGGSVGTTFMPADLPEQCWLTHSFTNP